jgi:hypothetical protein
MVFLRFGLGSKNWNWRADGALPNAEVFFSLRRDRTLSRSQDVFLDLSGRGLGKFLDEGDAVWRLEMREFCPSWTEFSISLVADSVYPTKLFASEILFSM